MTAFSPQQAADFERLVRSRRSVRGFLPQPVPRELMTQIFDIARWSPSGTNVQPWQICVASADVLEGLRTEFIARSARKDAIVTDHAPDGKVGDPWKERKRGCARALYGAMDIAWEDRQARAAAYERNYTFFDAPHAAFLCMHEVFGTQTAADVGMYAQTLMLAMTAHGIASCAQGTLRNFPDLVRETFGLDPAVKVLFGISFGYEDPAVAANAARTERAALEEVVQFLG